MDEYIRYLKYYIQDTIELIQELKQERRRVGDLPDEVERLRMWVSALEEV